MRRWIFMPILLIAILLVQFCSKAEPDAADANAQQNVSEEIAQEPLVIPASVAGSFYPAEPEKLKKDISDYLEAAQIPKIEGEIMAAIVPHAGYAYSAPVAAHAYKAIAENLAMLPSDRRPEAIIVVAFSHRVSSPYISVLPKGAMATPLGKAPVNESLASAIMNKPSVVFAKNTFAGEHSAEVQIPFIQTLFPKIPIVPVIFGQQNLPNVETVAEALEAAAKSRHFLVIATTDLSHYNPYEKAVAMDTETINTILKGDPRAVAEYISEHPDRLCGPGPVLTALSYAESRKATPMLLKYANSADTAGPMKAVVGYAAIVFVKKPDSTVSAASAADPSLRLVSEDTVDEYLTADEKKILLAIARQSLEQYVHEKKIYSPEEPASKRLKENGAAFVTLTKNGNLRGCIGHLKAAQPLYQTVADMAVAAASQDPRFRPVQPAELKDIHIEISVNTPLEPVTGPEAIVLGKHGVVVTKGLRQGVFLPQVATETGWSKEEFLRQLCMQKAGLPPDAYKNGARLLVFSSIVFEEEK